MNWLRQQCAAPAAAPSLARPAPSARQFWSATGTTFLFTVITVTFETMLGFWMAMIMARTFKGRSLVRAAVLVPWAIPTAVTAQLWLSSSPSRASPTSCSTPASSGPAANGRRKWAVIIADTWKTTPFMALLILAGLQMIPAEVYEAAKVDGATAWQRFRLITLPLVKPALMVAILFRTLDALRMFDLPYILTGGANNTTTLSILVINQIRQGFNCGGGPVHHHVHHHLPGRLHLRPVPRCECRGTKRRHR